MLGDKISLADELKSDSVECELEMLKEKLATMSDYPTLKVQIEGLKLDEKVLQEQINSQVCLFCCFWE